MEKKITSNSKLLIFCSHLVTSLHITVHGCPLPVTPSTSFYEGTSNCLPDSEGHAMSSARGGTPRPRSDWDVQIAPGSVFPAGTSLWEHLMVLFFLNLATRFPGLPQKTVNIEGLWQGCPELTSICLMLGCFFCLFVLIFKTSLTNTRVRDHVWATLRRAYLNCCPTYGICLNTRFANPTKVQLF